MKRTSLSTAGLIGAAILILALTTGCRLTPWAVGPGVGDEPRRVEVVQASTPEIIASVGASLPEVAGHEPGGSMAAFRSLERAIENAAAIPAARGPVARSVEATLRSGAVSSAESRHFLVTQLGFLGDPGSVDILAQLVDDDEVWATAIMALSTNRAPRATGVLAGTARGGVTAKQLAAIQALVERQDGAAVETLVALATGPDEGVARAALNGLGLLGDLDPLLAMPVGAPLADEHAVALLVAAERAEASDPARAASVFARAGEQTHDPALRHRALAGRLRVDPAGALDALVDAMTDGNPRFARQAAAMVAGVKDADTIAAFADKLPDIAPDAQVALLGSLAARGEPAAAPGIRALVASTDDDNVRSACLQALGVLGAPDDVPLLIQAAAGGGGARASARQALLLLPGGTQANAALGVMAASQDRRLASEALRALAGRQATGQVSSIIAAARSDDASVRRDALDALGALRVPDTLEPVLDMAVAADSDRERRAAVDAALAIGGAMDPGRTLPAISRRITESAGPSRIELVRLLSDVGNDDALALLRDLLAGDPSPELVESIARTMGQWPNAAPLDDLRAINVNPPSQVARVLALRGIVALATGDEGLFPAATAQWLAFALESSHSAAERQLVASALGDLRHALGFELLRPLLADGEVAAEAYTSALTLADYLRERDLETARDIIEAIESVPAPSDALAERAAQVASRVRISDGAIMDWIISGPYTDAASIGAESVHAAAFLPETDPAAAGWWPQHSMAPYPHSDVGVDLEREIGGDARAAYLLSHVWVPSAMPVRIEAGSDDDIKIWVDGTLVHERVAARGFSAWSDEATGQLDAGWNRILVKVTDGNGNWGGGMRVLKPDGSPIDGMRVTALPAEVQHGITVSDRVPTHGHPASPTLMASPATGAEVLLPIHGGQDLADAWGNAPWRILREESAVRTGAGDLSTREDYGSVFFHIEFAYPYEPGVPASRRGAAAIQVGDCVITIRDDSSGGELDLAALGAIEGLFAPPTNAASPPQRWQTLDVLSVKSADLARVTIWVNGINLHRDVELPAASPAGPIVLLNRGCPVMYRNAWVVREPSASPSDVELADFVPGTETPPVASLSK